MNTSRTNLLATAVFGFLASGNPAFAQSVIYSDSFTNSDATSILGLAPETNNGVSGAVFHESNNFWTQNGPVGVFSERAQLGADNQANLPIAASGDFVPPEKIGVSILLNMGTTAGPTTPNETEVQRGVGLGFFAGTSNIATSDNFRGLIITTDSRLVLAQHGLNGLPRAAFLAEIATDIDTTIDHTLAYEIDTTTGDISNILLDDVEQPDIDTDIFSSDINHVGFMVSSQSGGTLATYDDFLVVDAAGSAGGPPAITSIMPVDATTFELTIAGSPETEYALAASDVLDFEKGSFWKISPKEAWMIRDRLAPVAI
jgi:hypothetical protein